MGGGGGDGGILDGWRGGKVREGMPCEPLAPVTTAKMSYHSWALCLQERLWAKWGVGERARKRGLPGTERVALSQSPQLCIEGFPVSELQMLAKVCAGQLERS